jgi:hypothetical protein
MQQIPPSPEGESIQVEDKFQQYSKDTLLLKTARLPFRGWGSTAANEPQIYTDLINS